MRSPDLDLLVARAELYERAETTRQYVDYVQRHGLDLDRIADFAGATGILNVVDCGNGRFDWTARGEAFTAFVLEVLGEDGETVVDIAAWPLERPATVLTMFGAAPVLGLWE